MPEPLDAAFCWVLLIEMDVWVEAGLFQSYVQANEAGMLMTAKDSRIHRWTVIPPSEPEVEA